VTACVVGIALLSSNQQASDVVVQFDEGVQVFDGHDAGGEAETGRPFLPTLYQPTAA